jgi:hypothetical protein
MATTLQRNKNRTRPSKGPAARRRREKVQRKRLVALGHDEAALVNLTAPELRALLRRAQASAQS